MQARREHSRAELARKLTPHAQSAEQVEQVLATLAAKNLLSDARYAEALTRRREARFGAARIRQELQARGVKTELLRASTAALAATELERARAVWKKKFRGPPVTPAERARQMRFLASRGFAAEVVHKVIASGEDE
jgi:regulatory protein